MGVLEWEVIFVLINGLNWVAVLVYLWREWWPLLHLILRCGLLSHRLLNRLLCGLICGSNGFNVVHSDVVDESRLTAILREDDLRLMTETDLYRYIPQQDMLAVLNYQVAFIVFLTAGLYASDDIRVECLQQHTVWIGVSLHLLILKHEWKCLPFITTL